MLKFIKSAAVAALLSAAVVAPGYSQTVDTSAVVAACAPVDAIEADCLAAIDAFVAALAGLPAADADAALGVLAGDLAAASLEEGSNSAVIAAGLTAVAGEVTDPEQAAQIIQIAAAVEADTDIPVFAVDGGTPASPN
ncbi:hypothetical protein [Pelagibacterium halotolerans]|uniref:Secreted protein n=1 Tax=Pelagibacterium halotolerans (strain DSM 22347 / JCM 15775 / CGMCC 1.7692 / B2) TaxID=1082931 RepID=G4RGV1_PELHB|nr:hypothetical protein [Pelagibacterium halotolerans]AEQ53104.1 hypothetical protein KKY_3114 [Pelagibacterium halotolerans B2]QJR17253.1 hypothetical protein HKM20_01525 [Pelagibacterium halotolerans]SEA87869.1 hypothetical protein SAMN05428936_11092 [Pelagibacterium halotolerans]